MRSCPRMWHGTGQPDVRPAANPPSGVPEASRDCQRRHIRFAARVVSTLLAAVLFTGTGWAKAPLCGLVSMGKIGFQLRGGEPDNSQKEAWAHPGVYVGLVVNLRWEDLAPAPGQFEFAPLESALATIDQYNRANPAHRAGAKLRIFAGRDAPDWVVKASGGWIYLARKEVSYQVGHFWTPAYRAAWRALQNALARRYDNDPRIAEMTVASCSSNTDEPFILQTSLENLQSLHAAGFSDAAYRECLSGAVADYAAWRGTPLDFPFNPFPSTDSGVRVFDPDFTVSLMNDFRRQLGSRAILATHGLNALVREKQAPIYDALRALGPPIEFQFVAPHIDFDAAVANARQFRPTEIEAWLSQDAGGMAVQSTDTLASWKPALACNFGGNQP